MNLNNVIISKGPTAQAVQTALVVLEIQDYEYIFDINKDAFIKFS